MCLSARQNRARSIPCIAIAPIPAARCAKRHRPDGAAVRLVPSHARPRRPAVHRPARPLRPDPGGGRSGFAGLQGWPRSCAPNGWCGSTARCAGARPAPRIPDLPTGAVEVYINEIEVLGPAAELPMPVFGDQEYPEEIRLKYRFLDLRRERLHRNIIKRGADHRLDPPAHEGAGLLRVPDADPDRVVARRRARLPGAVAASIRASSTRCRRRRSSSSSSS